jgi:hypothetical protein
MRRRSARRTRPTWCRTDRCSTRQGRRTAGHSPCTRGRIGPSPRRRPCSGCTFHRIRHNRRVRSACHRTRDSSQRRSGRRRCTRTHRHRSRRSPGRHRGRTRALRRATCRHRRHSGPPASTKWSSSKRRIRRCTHRIRTAGRRTGGRKAAGPRRGKGRTTRRSRRSCSPHSGTAVHTSTAWASPRRGCTRWGATTRRPGRAPSQRYEATRRTSSSACSTPPVPRRCSPW